MITGYSEYVYAPKEEFLFAYYYDLNSNNIIDSFVCKVVSILYIFPHIDVFDRVI